MPTNRRTVPTNVGAWTPDAAVKQADHWQFGKTATCRYQEIAIDAVAAERINRMRADDSVPPP